MTRSTMIPSNRTALCTAKISALSVAMLLMQSNMAFAAVNPLVQIIDNLANVDYDVAAVKQHGTSNKVQVKVSALPEYGIGLTKQPVQTVMPNALVSWVNVLSNTSYSDQTVELTLDVAPTLSNIKIYQDLNKNGIIDSSDSEVIFNNLNAQILLGHSESIQLIVQALSDPNGKTDDTAEIQLGAIVLEDLLLPLILRTNSLSSSLRLISPRQIR